MPNTVQVIVESQKERLILESVFKNLGADTVFSQDLNDALAIFERARPRAVFIADGEATPAEIQIRELLRIAPFLPIVVLLKKRDSSRAVAYMKLGAFDCAQSPWTEEEIRPLYKKALNISGTTLRLDTDQIERFAKRKTALFLAGSAITLIFGFVSGWFYGFNKYNREIPPPSIIELPYSHPSGLAFEKGRVMVSDWYNQAIYRHDLKDFRITGVTSFPDTVPVGLADGSDNIWVAAAGGTMERRMKNEKLTLISKTKYGPKPPAGACYDGLYIWLAYAEGNKISKRLANDELTELRSFTYPGKNLTAIACDPRFLWVTDEGLKSLIKLSPDDPETILSKAEIPQWASKSMKITALGARDGKIWFASEDKGKGWLFNVTEPR
ncbi:MAG: hypothetical protein A2270_03555 [Elusimicrobia bacterium RIFOXYA12_FULL_51_18]|nr:MAG: hypothetical protein A2270_03555 [Elusimicrobia bacterium RIFOXYA12_FULL_51_18]OGS31921.1 MAG: hypothetical protein A2218_06520 [Elusimicrobia bacterium RIFOXYA2_FULL_53_38]